MRFADMHLRAAESATDSAVTERVRRFAAMEHKQAQDVIDTIEDTLRRTRCTVEITVPSGRLIAADSLLSVEAFNIDAPWDRNANIDWNAYSELLAKQVNTGYAFVSNSCPSVVRQVDGSLEVVSPEYGDNDEPVLRDGETVVAGICTDLWATMITDYQNWLDQGGRTVSPGEDSRFTLIDVRPGRYRFTIYSHAAGFDCDSFGRITYARLELIEAY